MKKIIDLKHSVVMYEGNLKELKDQLNFIREVHPEFKLIISEDMFKNFNETINPPKTLYENLSFNHSMIRYGPNGSPNEFKLLRINYYSGLADEKFVKKYGELEVKVILE